MNNLREKQTDGKEERELDIIERSSRQLREFSERTTRFLNTEVNDSESVQLSCTGRRSGGRLPDTVEKYNY